MIQLPAKQFDRCNDVIYTDDYKTFYFEYEGQFIEIKNISYLTDIQRVYPVPKDLK